METNDDGFADYEDKRGRRRIELQSEEGDEVISE
jgi:hypothetical protein